MGAVKPNKLPEALEAEADRFDPNREGLVFPHKVLLENKDADGSELEREGMFAELPNANGAEVVAVAKLEKHIAIYRHACKLLCFLFFLGFCDNNWI